MLDKPNSCARIIFMDKKEIEKILLLGYILLNGMFTGRTVNAIMATQNGYDTFSDIIINGALTALTAMRAIHYYRLNHKQK